MKAIHMAVRCAAHAKCGGRDLSLNTRDSRRRLDSSTGANWRVCAEIGEHGRRQEWKMNEPTRSLVATDKWMGKWGLEKPALLLCRIIILRRTSRASDLARQRRYQITTAEEMNRRQRPPRRDRPLYYRPLDCRRRRRQTVGFIIHIDRGTRRADRDSMHVVILDPGSVPGMNTMNLWEPRSLNGRATQYRILGPVWRTLQRIGLADNSLI